jgi:integrase/recombinase XerD
MTLDDHLKDFLEHHLALRLSASTLRSYRVNLTRFIKWLGRTFNVAIARHLRSDHLTSWMRSISAHRTRKGLPLKPSSINKNIENVRKFIRYLIKQGHIAPELFEVLEYVKEPDELPTSVMTHAQVKKLLSHIRTDSAAGYRDRSMFEILYSTGIRIAELLSIDVSHVDIKNAAVLVTGKGNKQRMVPIGKTALKYLQTYILAARPFLVHDPAEQALYLNQNGRRMGYQMFRKSLQQYVKKAKLNINITPHTFRRSCATELLRSGANMYHVKEILGHKTLNTLRHYAKLTITDLKKTHRKCHPRERDSE